MKRKTTLTITIITLIATYAIAFGLDRWTDYLRHSVSQAAVSPNVLLASWSFANLVLSVCVLSLYTWAFPRLAPWAIYGIVVTGLFIDFVPVLYWLPLGSPTLFLSQLMTVRGYFLSVGGWKAIAGIFTLWRRKAEK